MRLRGCGRCGKKKEARFIVANWSKFTVYDMTEDGADSSNKNKNRISQQL